MVNTSALIFSTFPKPKRSPSKQMGSLWLIRFLRCQTAVSFILMVFLFMPAGNLLNIFMGLPLYFKNVFLSNMVVQKEKGRPAIKYLESRSLDRFLEKNEYGIVFCKKRK